LPLFRHEEKRFLGEIGGFPGESLSLFFSEIKSCAPVADRLSPHNAFTGGFAFEKGVDKTGAESVES